MATSLFMYFQSPFDLDLLAQAPKSQPAKIEMDGSKGSGETVSAKDPSTSGKKKDFGRKFGVLD